MPDIQSDRNLIKFVNAFVPFIEEVARGVIEEYLETDLSQGDDRQEGRIRRREFRDERRNEERRESRDDRSRGGGNDRGSDDNRDRRSGEDRVPGGQGRVKDPEHDHRLKENQDSETPYQKYSAASKEEIRQARER